MQSVLNKVFLGMAVAVLAASVSTVSAQPKNIGMGTWKLNVEKSKYSPGPAPKSLTATFEPVGKGVKLTTAESVRMGSPRRPNTRRTMTARTSRSKARP